MCQETKKAIKTSFLPIAKALQKQGMTIYQLGKKTDINHATLYCWQNGDYKPKADKIIKVCDVLGLDFRDFL